MPFILHGSSGGFDKLIVQVIRAGLKKINVSTHLNAEFTGSVRRYLDENPSAVHSRKYIAAGRTAVEREAARLLALFA